MLLKVLSSVLMLVMLCSPLSAIGSDQPDPRTLEEGLVRIEKVLGKYDPKNQIEWRINHLQEIKSRPDPAKATVLMTWNGTYTIGVPCLKSNAIAFDHSMQWKRQVFDVSDAGEKKLTRVQCSHNVTRYVIVNVSGRWLVTGTMLSNGVHEAIDTPAFTGELKWHSDGFELLGNNAVAEFYGAEGKLILGIANGSVRYRRIEKVLKVDSKMQRYETARSLNGALLFSPDFSKPIGSVIDWNYESEPLMAFETNQ